eukprot:TRINITY_DN469_c0_g1_i1.p1 TRINITY_DN469_c0_g1~~TRINITY_DN469_c0_g1_i1.p1  ORF type:complete len:316 (+),score=68.71 TRINITY_DN469_c0_g1_i1:60-1007(+)
MAHLMKSFSLASQHSGRGITAIAPSSKNVFTDPKGSIRHANLRQLKDRIGAVNTVKKISQVMKVLTQQRIVAIQAQLMKTRAALEGPNRIWEDIKVDLKGKKNLFVVLSTDKGMCGGINAGTYRFVRDLLRERKQQIGIVPSIISIGELAGRPLARMFPQETQWHAAQFYKHGVSFPVVSFLAEKILKADADVITLVYNFYVNQISYEISTREFLMPSAIEENRSSFHHYEFSEGAGLDHMRDLHEFSFATFLYQALVENNASENAARLLAMDGASKNATELAKVIERLYNKKRQEKITGELLEIVSAAMFTPKR